MSLPVAWELTTGGTLAVSSTVTVSGAAVGTGLVGGAGVVAGRGILNNTPHGAGGSPETGKDFKGLSDSCLKALLKRFDTDPHSLKQEVLGKNAAISRFDVKMGRNGGLFVVSKDGSAAIATGIFP